MTYISSQTRAVILPDLRPGSDLLAFVIMIGTILALWGGAIVLWGLPGLAMGALTLVPVMMVVLLLITVGK